MVAMRVVLVSVGAVAVAPSPAAACSCALPTFSLPAAGATGAPTDLPEVLFEVAYWDSPPVRLIGPLGDLPLGTPVVTTYNGFAQIRVPVVAPLDPDTVYELRADGFDELSSAQVSFTTGDGTALAPPPAVALDGFALARAEFVEGLNWSCGQSITMVGGTATSAGDDPAAIEVTITGDSAPQRYVLPYPHGLSRLGSSMCAADLVVAPSREYCVEVRARDLVGTLGPPATACAVVRACNDLTTGSPQDLLQCPTGGDDEVSPGETGSGCTATSGGGGVACVVGLLGLLGLRRRR
jgi:uncharacterized protein (TIGR03382 family)